MTGVAISDIIHEVNEDVRKDSESTRCILRQSPDYTLIEGEVRFVDGRTVEIVASDDEGRTIRGETVLIAAGTRPWIADIDGL